MARKALALILLACASGLASCGSSSNDALSTPTPAATPTPTARIASFESLLLSGASVFGRIGPVISADGGAVGYSFEDAEIFEVQAPGQPPRMGVINCYRALAWRGGPTALDLGPDPGCPFPDPNPNIEWFGDSWPAAFSGDGAIAVVNRVEPVPPPIYASSFFGFADADGGWEEVVWSEDHPDGDRAPNAQANDLTPDGAVVVGMGWLEYPWPGFEPTDARAWVYRRGDAGPTWLAWSGDRVEAALAVSDDGRTIAGCCDDTRSTRALPVLWRGDDPPITLAPLPGSPICELKDLSGDGTVAVGGCGSSAVRWVESEVAEIRAPYDGTTQSPYFARAVAVSRDGSAILGWGSGGAWLWTADAGAKLVEELLSEAGIDVPAELQILTFDAMSADGKVLIGYAEKGIGETYSSFLVRAILP